MATEVTESTTLIAVDTGDWPLYLATVRSRLQDISLPRLPTEEQLAAVGYAVVVPTEKPTGDVVTEAPPIEENGKWYQSWTVRPYTQEELDAQLAEKKTSLLVDVQTLRTMTLEKGIPVDFGGTDGVQHVQLRDGDRANLTSLNNRAKDWIADGNVQQLAFITEEDNAVTITTEQALALTNAAYDKYVEIIFHLNDLKKQVISATELSALPTIPSEIEIDITVL